MVREATAMARCTQASLPNGGGRHRPPRLGVTLPCAAGDRVGASLDGNLRAAGSLLVGSTVV